MAASANNSILGNRLPDDARYTIHSFLTAADDSAYTVALGRFGQQLPLFSTPQGQVAGLSARKIMVQTARLDQKYETVKVGSGHKVYVLPKHQPEAIPFAQRFKVLRQAAKACKIDLLNDAFEGLKTCKQLTPGEKRELIEFVLRSQPLMIPNNQIVQYLLDTKAFEAASPGQIEALLKLAVAQTEGYEPSTSLLIALIAHLQSVDDRAVSGFDSIHPERLGDALIRLAGNRKSLDCYRSLAAELPDRVFTATVVSDLLSRLSMNTRREPKDFADLAPCFDNEELRTELNDLAFQRTLERLAVRAIDSKNPDLLRAFCRAVVSQDLFHVVKKQFEVAIEMGRNSPEYRALLQQAIATQGRFNLA